MSLAVKVVIAIVAVAVIWIIWTFNRLITLKNRAREAWADIDVQLKRRYNLIPNLVEAVKGYASHEKEVFQNVTKARTQAMAAKNPAQKGKAENALTETLKSLFAVAENYPELKASKNFLQLQRELRDTEDKIQAARRFYNTNVRDLNIKIESFPARIIANAFNFQKKELFELEETAAAREPVKVKF